MSQLKVHEIVPPSSGEAVEILKFRFLEKLLGGVTYRKDWVSGESYNEKDVVIYGDLIYRANVTHTAGETFALANWDLLDVSISVAGATPGEYTKVTVNELGKVVSGALLTPSDLPAVPAEKITGVVDPDNLGIGTPSNDLFLRGDGVWASPTALIGTVTETHIATAGQTLITLVDYTYIPGSNSIAVYLNGIRLESGVDYTESSNTTLIMVEALSSGDKVVIVRSERYTNLVDPTIRAQLAASEGASLVGFQQAGTGAVTTTVQSKLRETVSILDFMSPEQKEDAISGAKTLDLTEPIQAAVNHICKVGGTLNTGWKCKVTAPIVGVATDSRLSICIDGAGGELDYSSMIGDPGTKTALTIGGGVSTSSALNVDVVAGSTSISTTENIGVSAGDIVQITSTDLFNPTRPYYFKGELAKVLFVVGSEITFCSPLYDGYSAATTSVKKLIAPKISLNNITAKGNDNQLGLVVMYARDVNFSNNTVSGFRASCVYVYYSFGVEIRGNSINDCWYSGTGTSYGMGIVSSQHVLITSNTINGGRHAIAGGGREPCRDVVVLGNTALSHPGSGEAGIDAHGNCQYWIITSNVTSGIIMNGSTDSDIIGNTVLVTDDTQRAGIRVFQEKNSEYYNILNNTIRCNSPNPYGIYVAPYRGYVNSPASLRINRLVISGNQIDTVNSCVCVNPGSSTSSNCSVGRIVMNANEARNTGNVATVTFITSGSIDLAIDSIDISGGSYENPNFAVLAMAANTKASYPRLRLTNTRIVGQRSGSYLAVFTGVDVRLSGVYANGAFAGGSASRSLRFVNSGTTEVLDCVIEKFATGSGIELDAGGPALYFERGTRFLSTASKTTVNTASAQIISMIGNGERKIVWGAAIPTTGTWSVGDSWEPLTPVVGQSKGAKCTVAGTPGTWVSEGNL